MKQQVITKEGKKLLQGHSLEWRINTPAFLKEVFDNYPDQRNGGVLFYPANLFRTYLLKVAERAAEINDPVLNGLMCQMALYGIADPYDINYDHDKLMSVLNHPNFDKWQEKRKRK